MASSHSPIFCHWAQYLYPAYGFGHRYIQLQKIPWQQSIKIFFQWLNSFNTVHKMGGNWERRNRQCLFITGSDRASTWHQKRSVRHWSKRSTFYWLSSLGRLFLQDQEIPHSESSAIFWSLSWEKYSQTDLARSPSSMCPLSLSSSAPASHGNQWGTPLPTRKNVYERLLCLNYTTRCHNSEDEQLKY